MSKNVIYIGIAVVLAIILAGLYFYNLGHEDLSRKNPDYVISASDLYLEFSGSESDANEKYVNKVIQVTGILKDKEMTSDSSANLSLKTSQPSASVICSFTDIDESDLNDLKTGNAVTIRGICSGMLIDVLLNNCVLIRE